MSRVNLLLDAVEDMRSLADSLQSIADSIQGNTVCTGGNDRTIG